MTTALGHTPDPPEPPPPHREGADRHERENGYDTTTLRIRTADVRAAVAAQYDAQPDMTFTADWYASESALLHGIIEQHERDAARDQRVIDRLLDRIGQDAITISDLLLRADALEQERDREHKRAERLAQMVARGNSKLIPSGTSE